MLIQRARRQAKPSSQCTDDVSPEGQADTKQKKNYAGRENHSPHQSRKGGYLGPRHLVSSPPREENKPMGIRRTGSSLHCCMMVSRLRDGTSCAGETCMVTLHGLDDA
eukprot:1158864-Pelagomonas_calceolata.AAC.8